MWGRGQGGVVRDSLEDQQQGRKNEGRESRRRRKNSRAPYASHESVDARNREAIQKRGVDVIAPRRADATIARDQRRAVSHRRRVEIIEPVAAVEKGRPSGAGQVLAQKTRVADETAVDRHPVVEVLHLKQRPD